MRVGDLVTITPLDTRYATPRDYIVSHVGNRWITLCNEHGQERYYLDRTKVRIGDDWIAYSGSSRKNSDFITIRAMLREDHEKYTRYVELHKQLREELQKVTSRTMSVIDSLSYSDMVYLLDVLRGITGKSKG